MNRLFCSLQPFDMVQQIYAVDNNGNIVDTFSCTFDDMIEAVPSYCKNNNINLIRIPYMRKIEKINILNYLHEYL